ncbi:MAG: hypothetical protein IKP31_05900 [Lachnospiraceae bacterium]|nr:hypothetical protein [Lachnospiraceae bacterium]
MKADPLTEITEKISMQVKEDTDNFIFESIRPFCEDIVQTKISKNELVAALILYRNKGTVDQIMTEMCDKYCRFPYEYDEEKEVMTLQDAICSHCPMNKLEAFYEQNRAK